MIVTPSPTLSPTRTPTKTPTNAPTPDPTLPGIIVYSEDFEDICMSQLKKFWNNFFAKLLAIHVGIHGGVADPIDGVYRQKKYFFMRITHKKSCCEKSIES